MEHFRTAAGNQGACTAGRTCGHGAVHHDLQADRGGRLLPLLRQVLKHALWGLESAEARVLGQQGFGAAIQGMVAEAIPRHALVTARRCLLTL